MSENLTDEERADYFNPSSSSNGQIPDSESASYTYGALFDAPDFASLVKGRRSPGAREYENKVKSLLKSGAIGALRNGNLPDAAAILRHGPAFSAAVGDVCAVNDKAKQAVDLITSPENPYFALAFAAIPFAAQLFRNHEQQLDMIPQARKQARQRRKERRQAEDTRKVATLHIPILRREIKIRVGMRVNPFKGMRSVFVSTSKPPQELVTVVFSDQKLREALSRQGIEIVQVSDV